MNQNAYISTVLRFVTFCNNCYRFSVLKFFHYLVFRKIWYVSIFNACRLCQNMVYAEKPYFSMVIEATILFLVFHLKNVRILRYNSSNHWNIRLSLFDHCLTINVKYGICQLFPIQCSCFWCTIWFVNQLNQNAVSIENTCFSAIFRLVNSFFPNIRVFCYGFC